MAVRAVIGAATGLFLCCAVSPAWAEDDRREAARLRQRIQAVESSLGLAESRKDSAQGALSDIERRHGEIAKHLRFLSQEIAHQEQQMAHVRQQKEKLLASMRDNNRGINAQARAAYMMGRQEWLKLLLNPDDPARISRVLTYFDYLNRSRLTQLHTIKDGLNEVERLEQVIQAEKRRLEHTQAMEREEQNKLGVVRHSREGAMAQLREELRDKGARIHEVNSNLHRLDRLVASVDLALADMPKARPEKPLAAVVPQQRPVGMGPTKWPVTGQLLKRYGAGRLGGRWDGILIKADEGAPVSAAADGRVVFSDWLRGYGLLLIVDHGNGYMTLYAFNQSLYKSVGERVAAGEVISSVGRSGGRVQSALYFGVRQAGRPIDPLSWLQKSG